MRRRLSNPKVSFNSYMTLLVDTMLESYTVKKLQSP
jgi:hypothetical protein